MPTPRRVTVVAHELRGFHPAGGMGTATTFLALGLARRGHSVEILLGKHDPSALDDEWRRVYEHAGVRIRPVPPPAESVEPWHFLHAHRVALGLLEDPPDVVVAHDFGAPAYSALRMRQAGMGLDDTLFVIFCHGTRRYVLDLSPSIAVGDLRTVVGVSILEQAALELADVVVSPSAYLFEWMRRRGWRLAPRTVVIPYVTRSGATGETPPAPARGGEPLRRLTFFGRVDERKGLRTFAAALNELRASLDGLDVEFVGKTTRTWPRDRVEALLATETRHALARVDFVDELDQQAALARLRRDGTLVVMPSLQDNSPNTVYECLEHGIPFVASDVGGVSELIAEEDRERTLFAPTAESLADRLRRVLELRRVPPPVRPAFDPSAPLDAWDGVLDLRPNAPSARDRDAETEPFVLLTESGDVADAGVRPVLERLQRASGADVVTCGVRLVGDDGVRLRFFEGDAGGLGALGNSYGTAALVRRRLLRESADLDPAPRDSLWPLLAELTATGASIVSLPVALVERRDAGSLPSDPLAELEAVQALERALPPAVAGAARIAAGLEAHARERALTRPTSRRRRRGWLR